MSNGKLRALIVDDYQCRHDAIMRHMSDAGFCLESRHRFSPDGVTDDDLGWAQVAFLDHDMCQRAFVDGVIIEPDPDRPCPRPIARGRNGTDLHCGCPTGADLAMRMASSTWRPGVLVHSANPVGAKNMTSLLENAGFRVAFFPATRWEWFDWRHVVTVTMGAKP